MENQNISFLAPSLFQQHWSTTEVLGSIIWVWMHSPHHQQYTIQTFRQHVITAVNCHQFAIFYSDQQPIAYFTWAMFDEHAEQAYIHNNRSLLKHPQNWNCGTRMWLIDWFSPFGHTLYLKKIIKNQLFPTSVSRHLYHRGHQKQVKIMLAKGAAISPEEFAYWIENNPINI